MFNPTTLFLQRTDEGGMLPTTALSELMRIMGVAECATFTDAAKAIDAAGWSRMPSLGRDEKAALQTRQHALSNPLGRLQILHPHTNPTETCLTATHAVIPGAGYQQMKLRLNAGVDALSRNCFPKLTHVAGLAAVQRKPVMGEVDDISLSAGIRFEDCVIQQDSAYLVQEGKLLEILIEAAAKRSYGLAKATRAVVTTDKIPPEALAGRPTNLSTLFAWKHVMQQEGGGLPEKCVIWSVCPYGLRLWIEASIYVPEVHWALCTTVAPDWSVAGALSEVGKVVYTINQTLEQK